MRCFFPSLRKLPGGGGLILTKRTVITIQAVVKVKVGWNGVGKWLNRHLFSSGVYHACQRGPIAKQLVPCPSCNCVTAAVLTGMMGLFLHMEGMWDMEYGTDSARTRPWESELAFQKVGGKSS